MARFRFFAVLLLAATSFAAPAAIAQGCNFGDDGLAAVPCCAPAQVTLPQFPAFRVSGRYACFKDCGLEMDFPVRVTTSHIVALCDYAVVPLTVIPGTAISPGFNGVLLAKYSRTWMEPDPTGLVNRQVWRFLINGDLTPTAGASPCPLPPHPPGMLVHFHGHLDYACEPTATGIVFRMALSLHHLQGCVEHGFFSMMPLFGPAAHDDRSYHLVAPGNFAFGPVQPLAGSVVAEAVRSTQFAPTYACLGEGQLVRGQIAPRSTDCVCVVAPGPLAYVHYSHVGTVNCIGATWPYQGVPIGAPLPPLPTGSTALPIGSWNLPLGTFPENRKLIAHWGLLRYQDPCNTSDPPFHFVQGVSTGGHSGILFSHPGAMFRDFLDLQNMLNPSSLWGGAWVPAWGGLYISKVVWNVNLR